MDWYTVGWLIFLALAFASGLRTASLRAKAERATIEGNTK